MEVVRRAGQITGTEAAAVGIDLVFAPVADLDIEGDNPIVGTRAFGSDPERVARLIAAWLDGCQSAGVTACAKHFPGHGRTRGDSHLDRAAVGADRERLEDDVVPFRRAIRSGIGALMMGHVVYPALDPEERPASRSPRIIQDLLRSELGFDGVVVTDALDMGGAREEAEEDPAALSFLAGCDLLVMPPDYDVAARAVRAAAQRDAAGRGRLSEALARRAVLLRKRSRTRPRPEARTLDERWAAETALRAIQRIRGPVEGGGYRELRVLDDDRGGPHPAPSRETFSARIRDGGLLGTAGGPDLVAVFSDPRAWKGRAGLSDDVVGRCHDLHSAGGADFVLFSHPRNAAWLPEDAPVWCAWGGEPRMQQAAAERLLQLHSGSR